MRVWWTAALELRDVVADPTIRAQVEAQLEGAGRHETAPNGAA